MLKNKSSVSAYLCLALCLLASLGFTQNWLRNKKLTLQAPHSIYLSPDQTSSNLATAEGPARAQWLSRKNLQLKLHQGISAKSGLHFYLDNSSALLQNSLGTLTPAAIEVIPDQVQGGVVSLNTESIALDKIDTLIRQALRVITVSSSGQILDSTGVQLAGLLDDLYFYDGNDLGPQVQNQSITVKLWAPTARQVRLFVYDRANSDEHSPLAILPLNRQAQGVWAADVPTSYQNYFYLYEVDVYRAENDQYNTSLVTDPYSVGLGLNSSKTQLLNLNSPSTQPAGWQQLSKPDLESFTQAVIYETHLRDVSILDTTLPEMHRGTYLAFSHPQSLTAQYFAQLAQAGVTHIHIMPFFDFATVNEDKSTWLNYTNQSNDLEEAQNVLGRIRNQDPYAWGYDPVHLMAPDGSYAVANDGEGRVRELRTMIMNLNQMNLRVVQDIVFNHTYSAGLDKFSVFDRIVPAYYFRLDDEGRIRNTSCCADTASEHLMMEKFMIDAVVSWAKNFKIDGFRFDLMSFHTVDNMNKIRAALNKLTPWQDGVDGTKIIIYGEAWSFGSLYEQSPQTALTQLQSTGLGIGTFNDRIRDAIRGGTTDGIEKSDQGFATGLFDDFNKEPANHNTPVDLGQQRDKLLHLGDVIKVGLAGNVRDFTFKEHLGQNILSQNLIYKNNPVAYAADPSETINYVSAHDGYTLWDAIQAKAPFYTQGRTPALSTVQEKLGMHKLALGLVLFSQGIPFIEGGSEVLHSKCGDQDSYDSGDFFNAVDYSLLSENWGRGLPPAWKNYNDWGFWYPRLQEKQMHTTASDRKQALNYFLALLQVRKSIPELHLTSSQEISQKLRFIDNDSQAEPGLIAMRLSGSQKDYLFFFNSSRQNRLFKHSLLAKNWTIHPLLNSSVDPSLSQVQLTPSDQSVLLPARSILVLIGNKR